MPTCMDPTETTELVDRVRRAQKGEESAQRDLIVAYQLPDRRLRSTCD